MTGDHLSLGSSASNVNVRDLHVAKGAHGVNHGADGGGTEVRAVGLAPKGSAGGSASWWELATRGELGA